jgi:hypothetical protein
MNENNLSNFLRETEKYIKDDRKTEFERVINLSKNLKMKDILNS